MKLRIVLVLILVLAIAGTWLIMYRNRKLDEFGAEFDAIYGEYRQRRHAEAERRLLAIAPQAQEWWATDIHRAVVPLALGRIYVETNRFDEAEPLLKEAKQLYEKAGALKNPDYAKAMMGLGWIHLHRLEYNQAETLTFQAVSVLRENPDKTPSAVVTFGQAFEQAGAIGLERGNYQSAALMYVRAIEEYERAHGAGRDHLVRARIMLGNIYDNQNKGRQAEELYRDALTNVGAFRPGDPQVLDTLAEAASYHANADRPVLARQIADRAMQAFDSMAGRREIPPQSVARLAFMLFLIGRPSEAESLYLRSLDLTQKAKGAEHPWVATLHHELGELYTKIKRYPEAEKHLQRAVELFEKSRGPEHISTGLALSQLSLLRYFQEKDAEAESLARRALPIVERGMGVETVQYGMCLNRLALALEAQRKYPEAESAYKQAIEIRERVQGADHRGVATTLENLARTYVAQRKFAEAEPLIRRAATIRGQYAAKARQSIE